MCSAELHEKCWGQQARGSGRHKSILSWWGGTMSPTCSGRPPTEPPIELGAFNVMVYD